MAGHSLVWTTSGAVLVGVVLSLILSTTMGLLGGKKWKPQGKNVFITGGSQGLGLALAELLAAKGANVTICSRTESKLREAVEKVKVS
jgi:3-dehydrosphinganine reductase